MINTWGVARVAISLMLFSLLLAIGPSGALARSGDEDAARGLVESFLVAVGEGDLDALPGMFVARANIGTASLRDGSWVTSTMTLDEWLATLRGRTTWIRFRELVSEFTVHVEDSRMAFVRADATVFVEGQARSHNIDYFTLVRVDDTWKFLSASYVAKPVAAD